MANNVGVIAMTGEVMKRPYLVRAAAIITVLTCATVLSLTTLAGASKSKSAPGTITVTAKETSLKPNALGVTLTDDYFQGTKNVGGDQIGCILTGPGTLGVCTGVNVLPKGDIMTVASIPLPPPHGQKIDVAILGGTGSYRKARGTVDYTPINDTDKTITFHISS